MDYEKFRVLPRDREPLLEFMLSGLRSSGCVILYNSPSNEAPFRITFATPWGERIGIIAYAFLANSRITKNRPSDEHRFQIKYGSKDGRVHHLFQDHYGLYTTIFLGINPDRGFFVGADPVLNSPTKFFISKEFKEEHAAEVLKYGWFAWERDKRGGFSSDEPVDVLVGGTASSFLRYVMLEREAKGEDQGHRQYLAESGEAIFAPVVYAAKGSDSPPPSASYLHQLEKEFSLTRTEILEVIASAPRLKMAVRGWVAEQHLERLLQKTSGVNHIERPVGDGKPDFLVGYRSRKKLVSIECKNVLRQKDRHGRPRLDFMRTRTSKADVCSRFYSARDFDLLAACLHASTANWDFAHLPTTAMAPHKECSGKLDHRVVVDDSWDRDIAAVLEKITAP